METLKELLKTKEEENPIIFTDNSLDELTVLHMAAFLGHLNITIWYKDVLGFSDINPKDNKGNTPLYWATRQGHLDVVKYYIENDYHASSKIFSSFMNYHLCLANTLMNMHSKRYFEIFKLGPDGLLCYLESKSQMVLFYLRLEKDPIILKLK